MLQYAARIFCACNLVHACRTAGREDRVGARESESERMRERIKSSTESRSKGWRGFDGVMQLYYLFEKQVLDSKVLLAGCLADG